MLDVFNCMDSKIMEKGGIVGALQQFNQPFSPKLYYYHYILLTIIDFHTHILREEFKLYKLIFMDDRNYIST